MKIFNREQIRAWDAYTLQEKQISETDLMNDAAKACMNWLQPLLSSYNGVMIFCGKGNNGGDGLAIARMLFQLGVTVSAYRISGSYSQANTYQAGELPKEIPLKHLSETTEFPAIPEGILVIDALLGTGLKQAAEGLTASLIQHINSFHATVVSVDIASGVCTDECVDAPAIQATHTLSFQQYKLAFFRPEYAAFNGTVHVLPIGLSESYEQQTESTFECMELKDIRHWIKPRAAFSHKGSYGHTALLAGSFGMMGAAILAARGCLASGVGKLTCYVPSCGYEIMQTAVPEALCIVSGKDTIKEAGDTATISAIGAGPGLGTSPQHVNLLRELFMKRLPMVLDADALNVMASYSNLFQMIPEQTIITPHPGEFRRLFGLGDAISIAMDKALQHRIVIVLKGKYTMVATPEGKGYFIPTGNPGMAKGGMGDVLTGIISGLLAQGYNSTQSSIIGAYLHGLAGDVAAEKLSQPSMQAGDVVTCMADAWKAFLK